MWPSYINYISETHQRYKAYNCVRQTSASFKKKQDHHIKTVKKAKENPEVEDK